MPAGREADHLRADVLLNEAEGAALLSLTDASERPDRVAAQLAACARPADLDPDASRREMAELERALSELAVQEGAAVQAQIRRIMAGASPNAYAEAFGQIAARRNGLEDERGQLRRALDRCPRPDAARGEGTLRRQALTDVREALASGGTAAARKRDLLGTVIERVICRKGGGEVVFLPWVFADLAADTVQGVSKQHRQERGIRRVQVVGAHEAYAGEHVR